MRGPRGPVGSTDTQGDLQWPHVHNGLADGSGILLGGNELGDLTDLEVGPAARKQRAEVDEPCPPDVEVLEQLEDGCPLVVGRDDDGVLYGPQEKTAALLLR